MFLYLSKREYVATWINGGIVPLYPASTYRTQERKGIYTPDENKQISVTGENISVATKAVIDSAIANTGMGTLNFRGNVYTHDGVLVSSNVIYTDSYEDALVLCFSKTLHRSLAIRMNKTACVEIKNISELKKNLDSQVGVFGRAGSCEYTNTSDRNHFLKAIDDSWQSEYRIIWTGFSESLSVNLPDALAIDRTYMLKL